MQPEHSQRYPNNRRIRALDLPPPSNLLRHAQHSEEWRSAGEFIRANFAEHYQARIRELPSTLVAIQNACGETTAVSGLRYGVSERLFLEQYLDGPIENYLGSAGKVDRSRIVEICNLAAPTPGQVRYLLIALGTYLHSAGYEWVVCTAIGSLCNTLARMSFAPVILGMADPARLGAAAADWGSYYAKRPRVIAGHLAEANQVLSAKMAQKDSPLRLLWHSAARLGQQDRIAEPASLATTGAANFGTVSA
ncbi:MAG: thermostable hemolysin [Gammaproteobacteria bacterium]